MKKNKKFSEGLLKDDLILQSLGIKFGQTVLDAGCGNGYMAKKFSILVGDKGKVYALDPEKESIRILKEHVNKSNIEPLVGDITKLTRIKENSIDLVYLALVFHIFSNNQIEGFEKEVKRVLAPSGQLAIVNINKSDTPFGPPLEKRSSPEELVEMLSLLPKKLTKIGDHFYMQQFAVQ